MSLAKDSREQTNSEPVSNRTEESRLPIATASSRPFMLSDASSPVLTLSTDPSTSPLAFLRLQTKLTINQPGDQYEQEADRVAEQVMRMPDPAMRLQRQCGCDASASGPCEQCGARLIQRRATAGDPSSSAAAPGIVHDTLRSPGQALDSSTRAFFETRFKQDFGQVRVHTDKQAATSARQVGARAYTVGRDIVFGPGEYAPTTTMGRQLLAHELAHVVQQRGLRRDNGSGAVISGASGNCLQRRIDEADLPGTPVTKIMEDETYFENGITRIEFLAAELAILHYEDKSTIQLGLVPELVASPFEAVDYRTQRSEHAILPGPGLGPGSIRFIPHARRIETPEGTTLDQIESVVARTISFRVHKPSGRIVPTEVNSVSAPRLSAALRQAEAEYVRQMDEMAKGMVKKLQIFEWAIIIASVVGGLAAAATRRAAASSAAAVLPRAQNQLVRFFLKLLRDGTAESLKVEGVELGSVRVAMRGTELMVQHFSIRNVSRIPGRGRLIFSAFEQAAIQAARDAGAKTARVAVEMVVEPAWQAHLDSLLYTKKVFSTPTGIQGLWTKVFTL